MSIVKSQSKSQRSRRKMREAKARLAAAQDAIKLGGTPWKFTDFNLRPYAGKVEPSAVEGMKASTRPPAKKFTPNSVSNLRAEKRTHELRSQYNYFSKEIKARYTRFYESLLY